MNGHKNRTERGMETGNLNWYDSLYEKIYLQYMHKNIESAVLQQDRMNNDINCNFHNILIVNCSYNMKIYP